MKGKTVMVTGGTRGIGRAIAQAFAAQGANIVINYRSNEAEASAAREALESYGVEVLAVKADISDFQQVASLVEEAILRFKTIDVLVNNAGITRDNLMIRMEEAEFDQVIDTNLKGAFNCMHHVAKKMLKQRQGRIINIASVSGLVGNAGQINYAASKAGLVGMTKTAARECAARGVTVNAVAPGFIETEMTAVLPENVQKDILTKIPLKRMGKPEEVAALVSFLASEASSYITGQLFTVDGGMTM